MKKKTNIILFTGLALILVIILVFEVITVKRDANQYAVSESEQSGKIVTDVRDVDSFCKIVNEGAFNIKFVQSEKSQVVVKGDEWVMNKVSTEVRDGELEIYNYGYAEGSNCEITVYSPNCTEIKNEGVGNIVCDSISASKLKIENEGVGHIEIKNVGVARLRVENAGVGAIDLDGISAESIDVENEGVGSVTIAGKAKTVRLENEGVGSIDATGMDCEDISVDNDGLGKIVSPSR